LKADVRSRGVGGAYPDIAIQRLVLGVGERGQEGIRAIVLHLICRRHARRRECAGSLKGEGGKGRV